MTVSQLISLLQTMPPKAQVMLWEGFNREFCPKFDVSESIAERFYIPKRKNKVAGVKGSVIMAWQESVDDCDPAWVQRKQIVCIQPVFESGKKIDGFR